MDTNQRSELIRLGPGLEAFEDLKAEIEPWLTGLARPDSGTIRIARLDCAAEPKAAQHLVGVVPDESNLYPELSGFDNLCAT